MYNYLGVVHKPHQASLLGVQYEVTTQELAAALVLLDVEEAADAVLSVHVRHLASETFPGLRRRGGGRGGGAREQGNEESVLKERQKQKCVHLLRLRDLTTWRRSYSLPEGSCDTHRSSASTL